MDNEEEINYKNYSNEEIKDISDIVTESQNNWEELHRRILDKNHSVRMLAAKALHNAVLTNVLDLEKAWKDLIKMISEENFFVLRMEAERIEKKLKGRLNKQDLSSEIDSIVTFDIYYVRSHVASALKEVFPYLSDRQHAWEELIKLTSYKNTEPGEKAAEALERAVQHVLKNQNEEDKQKIREYTSKVISSEYEVVGGIVGEILGDSFYYVPDKEKAWEDLITLASNKKGNGRNGAAWALPDAFQYARDKEKAWKDVIKLTEDKDWYFITSGARRVTNTLSFRMGMK